MIALKIRPWRKFKAINDHPRVRRWLDRVGDETIAHFKGQMKAYPPASLPGAYPNIRTGGLIASIRKQTRAMSVEIGSGVFYSVYLAKGTRKMAKRKMSAQALQETLPKLHKDLKGFARWRRG